MPDKKDLGLILASGSPRRRELLKDDGYDFNVIVPCDSVEASVPLHLSPEEYVKAASAAKAKAVAALAKQGIVLAADTVAVCDGQIIGKPVDCDDAKRILMTLQGREHQVLTGVTICNVKSGICVSHVESTDLVMSRFRDDELDAYLESGGWQGKAGAFGYQDGIQWVEIKRGLESNVVGLPIEKLPELFEQVG